MRPLPDWRIQWVTVHDLVKGFCSRRRRITRDLHCREIAVTYQFTTRRVWLEFRLAFPGTLLASGLARMGDLRAVTRNHQGGAAREHEAGETVSMSVAVLLACALIYAFVINGRIRPMLTTQALGAREQATGLSRSAVRWRYGRGRQGENGPGCSRQFGETGAGDGWAEMAEY